MNMGNLDMNHKGVYQYKYKESLLQTGRSSDRLLPKYLFFFLTQLSTDTSQNDTLTPMSNITSQHPSVSRKLALAIVPPTSERINSHAATAGNLQHPLKDFRMESGNDGI